MTPQEVYDWIIRIEEKFMDTNVPFTDSQIKMLIKYLRIVEPHLKRVEPDNDAWDNFADKMEVKFLKADDPNKIMLVDFCKHIIHTKILMCGGRQ